MFNLVSKSFNFLSPTTTSLVAAEADSEVGLERGVFTPPMAAVASSALAVALGGGAVIGAGMACFASPLLGALNACSAGVGVVNIDNGFGAATLAARIVMGGTRRVDEAVAAEREAAAAAAESA